MARIVLAGRFWGQEPSHLEKVRRYINMGKEIGFNSILVAINENADKSGALELDNNDANIFGVKPWGRFTPALNALIGEARDYVKNGGMLFASMEISLNFSIVKSLASHMNANTLVVGARLQGHDFVSGSTGGFQGNGRQIPWNTVALWNLEKLYPFGFSNAGEGLPEDPSTAGVEELCTMSVIQSVLGAENAKVKMVEIPGIKWETTFDSEERQLEHEKKMQSKIERPVKQLQMLGLKEPVVWHIK